jgi:hypothetical protein
VRYSPIEVIKPDVSVEFLHRLLAGDLSAFIVKNAGPSVIEALENTGLLDAISSRGYYQTSEGVVPFAHGKDNYIPDDFAESGTPLDPDWHLFGVTQLHQDATDQAETISLNSMVCGSAVYRIHRLPDHHNSATDYGKLCLATGTILINGEVDREVVNPDGWSGTATAGDLTVIDTSYLHMAQSVDTPRLSEAVFYTRRH